MLVASANCSQWDKPSKKKQRYVLPKAKIVNFDLLRINDCDEIQSVMRPIKN